jgi:hypothetical protein
VRWNKGGEIRQDQGTVNVGGREAWVLYQAGEAGGAELAGISSANVTRKEMARWWLRGRFVAGADHTTVWAEMQTQLNKKLQLLGHGHASEAHVGCP